MNKEYDDSGHRKYKGYQHLSMVDNIKTSLHNLLYSCFHNTAKSLYNTPLYNTYMDLTQSCYGS